MKCVQVFYPLLKTEFFVSLLLRFKTSQNILNTSPSSDMWFANIFAQSVASLFILCIVSLEEQKFLILMRTNLPILISGVLSKKSLFNPRSYLFSLIHLIDQVLYSGLQFILNSYLFMVQGMDRRVFWFLLICIPVSSYFSVVC